MNKVKKLLSVLLCFAVCISMAACGSSSASGETEKAPETSAAEPDAVWSIYIYMVGSDLEDAGLDQLSKLTAAMVKEEAETEKANYDNMVAQRITSFTQEVSDMGMTLPNVLYNKSVDEAEKEKNTDLDSTGYGSQNFESILNSDLPEGVRYVIQTGGAKRWQSSYVNPNRSQRFVIDCNGICKVTDEPVKNMANPDTLEEFMVFCKEKYPAENEVMLFWDHGGGYSGYGVDDIFGTDMLTIREMAGAMQNVQKLYSPDQPLFDIIAFDACLMSNLETARLFRDYADYYLASPEILAGVGWGYADVNAALLENVHMTPTEFGEAAAGAYVDHVQLEGFDGVYPATYAVLDLSAIEPIYDAYSAFARKALKDSLTDVENLTAISAIADGTLAYAVGNSGGFNLIDLGLFADQLAPLYPEEAEAIREALDKCVLCTVSTSYYSESSGMSVFFPAEMTGLISLRKYLSYTCDVSDNLDIDALYYYKITGGLNDTLMEYVDDQCYGDVEFIDYSILEELSYLECSLPGDGSFSFSVPDELRRLVQRVSFGLVYLDAETSDVAYFGEFSRRSFSRDGVVSSDFNLVMPSLGDNELPIETVHETETEITYRVPILWYDVECYMLFTMDKATREYTILGFTVGGDNGTGAAERTVITFEEGDPIYVRYKYGNLYSNVESYAYGEYVYSPDLKIVDKTLSDGYYYEYIRFDDLRSDIYYSPMVFIRVQDGEITEQRVDWSVNAFDTAKKQ